jgi:ribosomal protein S18 acetylase RimI-like enzyme
MERAMHAAAAAEVVDGPWGHAFLKPELPAIHVENFVWAAPDAIAPVLADAADAVLGGAGLEHRVVAGPATPGTAGLGVRGWHVTDEPFLALARPPDRVDAGPAREVPLADVLPGIERWHATELAWARDPGVRRQAVEHHRTYGAAGAEERVFAVFDGDLAVAWAKLWTRDGVRQVEDVAVLPEWRGRGHGRHVVTAALQAAAGAELVVIVAAEDDWPKELYGRLGFDRIGRFHVVTRAPA